MQRDVQPKLARTLGEQHTAADDHERTWEIETGESETEIRADACGLTRGDGYQSMSGLSILAQSLYSTYASSRSRRSQSSVSSSAFASRSAVSALANDILRRVELATA
jgi:hypothetical protein